MRQRALESLSPHRYYLLVFLVISMVPFCWFRSGLPIGYWDTAYGFYLPGMVTGLDVVSYAWDYSLSSGRLLSHYSATYLPVSLMYTSLQGLGIGTAFIQAVLLSV